MSALEQQLRQMRERGTLQAAKSEVHTMQNLVTRQEEQLEALRREICTAQADVDRPEAMEVELRKVEEANKWGQQALFEAERSREEAATAHAAAALADAKLTSAKEQRAALIEELRLVQREMKVATQQATYSHDVYGAGGSGDAALVLQAAREKLEQMKAQVEEVDRSIAVLLEKAQVEAGAKAASQSQATLTAAEARLWRTKKEWEQARQKQTEAFALAEREAMERKEHAKREAARSLEKRKQQAAAYDAKLVQLKTSLARSAVRTVYGKEPEHRNAPHAKAAAVAGGDAAGDITAHSLKSSASLPSLPGKRTSLGSCRPSCAPTGFTPNQLRLLRSGCLSALSPGEIAAALLAAAHLQGKPISSTAPPSIPRARHTTRSAPLSERAHAASVPEPQRRAATPSELGAAAVVPLSESCAGSRAPTPTDLRRAAATPLPHSSMGNRVVSSPLDRTSGQLAAAAAKSLPPSSEGSRSSSANVGGRVTASSGASGGQAMAASRAVAPATFSVAATYGVDLSRRQPGGSRGNSKPPTRGSSQKPATTAASSGGPATTSKFAAPETTPLPPSTTPSVDSSRRESHPPTPIESPGRLGESEAVLAR